MIREDFSFTASALRLPRALLAAALLCAVAAFAAPADAAHHRFSHIHWSPGAGPNEINFVVQNAWAFGFATRIDPNTLSTLPGVPGVGDIVTVTGGPPPRLHFGDGDEFFAPFGSGSLLYLVTSVDPANNWFFGVGIDHYQLPSIVTSIPHTYAAPGDYIATISACCRLSPGSAPNRHINNAGAPYRIQTTVNVGTGNSAPVSLVPPVVPCVIGSVCMFPIVAADPDGDTLRFRFSTPFEATGAGSFNQPGPPHALPATIDPDTGFITWDTSGADLGGVDPNDWNVLYSTHVTIEDLDENGNVKSASAVDFFIQLVKEVGDPPTIALSPFGCASTIPVTEGDMVSFTVEASDADAGDIVTLNAVGLPAGAVMDPPLPAGGNPVSSDFSWTPGPAQVGTHIIIFTATDQNGQSASCSVTISVEAAPTDIAVPFDIRPTSCPNPINVVSRGVLPAAILGTASFDVTQVNPATVRLEGVAPIQHNFEDVATPFEPFVGKQIAFDCTTEGPDGFLDMTLKFRMQDIVATFGPVSWGDVLVLQLTGELFDGTAIFGEDVVRIIVPGDLNMSFAVAIPDLAMMLGSWGPCPDPILYCPGDLTGDEMVGAADLAILLSNFGVIYHPEE